MPVQTPHSQYSENIPVWKRCRTLSAGQRAVRAAATEFLPKLSGQDSDMYQSYLKRAYYFNAAGRTADGLVGVVFRKPPAVEFPKAKQEWLQSVSKEGATLESYTRRVFREVVTVARHGVLLDLEMEEVETEVDPYFTDYIAENIINWRFEKIAGVTRLSMVVLKETREEKDPQDPFVLKKKEIIRVLKLQATDVFSVTEGDEASVQRGILTGREDEPVFTKAEGDAAYVVEIWVKQENKDEKEAYVLESTTVPRIRGIAIPYIPFVFLGPSEASAVVQKPMIEDICDVNESHYHTSADIEHGRHFTALPTAWVAGFKTDQKLVIGSETAWVSEEPNASAGFLEYTGQGLKALETALDSKEKQMAVLGARLLETPRKAVESEATLTNRKAGEQSILASAAGSVEAGFTQLLKWAVEWMTGSERTDVEVIFNKDYLPSTLDPAMLQAMFLLLQGRAMSLETFAYNLHKGEMYPDGHTIEKELEQIAAREEDMPKVDLGEDEDSESEDEDDKTSED